MKLIIILAFWSFSSWAIDPDCKNRILSSMKTESEKYLLKNHPKAIDQFASDCRQIAFGDMGILSGIAVVHEAAHFEDLGFNNKEKKQNLNLYLISNQHVGGFSGIGSLPNVQSWVNAKLKDKYSNLLSSKETPFMKLHSGYINDSQSMASENLIGMTTELNAYTHGLKFEARVKETLSQKVKLEASNGSMIEVDNSLKPLKQTEGVYYFIFNFNLYLTELKNKHPEQWKTFNNQANKKLLKQLFASSISTLKDVKHCEIPKDEGNSQYWIKLMKEINPSDALMEFLEEEDRLSLNCSTPEENLRKSLSSDKECIE